MDQHRKVTVTVTNKTIVRAILWVGAAVVAYHFIGRLSHILTLIFLAFFLAMALNPVVSWMRKRLKIQSRVRATAASFVLIVAILAAFVILIVPPEIRQTRDFIRNFPQTVDTFQKQDTSLTRAVKRYHLDQKLTEGAKNLTSHYGNFGTTILDTGRRVGEAIASMVAVLVLAFMMLVEGPKWADLAIGLVPNDREKRYRRLSRRMYGSVTGFVNGQLLLALIAGFFAYVALQIASHVLDVSINSLALAGIVVVFGIIPLFGNPLAAILVVLTCLLTSAPLAIIMAIYFLVYFFVENHTFQPVLQARLNDLSPLTVFVAALIGVGVAGILGAIVAIPVANSIKILLEDYFERHQKHKAPTETATS